MNDINDELYKKNTEFEVNNGQPINSKTYKQLWDSIDEVEVDRILLLRRTLVSLARLELISKRVFRKAHKKLNKLANAYGVTIV